MADNKEIAQSAIEMPDRAILIGEMFKQVLQAQSSNFIEAVKISSGIDPSVRLIGSHISVLKPYFMENRIPDRGLYMVQPCIRTRNMASMFNESVEHAWGSYFVSLGLIVKEEDVQNLFSSLVGFFKDIGVNDDKLLVRASSKDADLVNLASEHLPMEIELDTQKSAYYCHKLGIDDVQGRNFNIAILDEVNGTFSDVGNVIRIEDNQGRVLCYELALGVSTILKQIYSLRHVLDIHDLPNIANFNGSHEIKKFQDCVISSRVLLGEGLRPFGDDNRARLLKSFLQGILYFRLKYNLLDSQIRATIDKFESKELPDQHSLIPYIMEYISSYSKTLTSKQNPSKTEQLILNLMQ